MFVYTAPTALSNRVQYITIRIETGYYSGIQTSSCGDAMWGGDVDRVIKWAARYNGSEGETRSKVSVSFDTGRTFETIFNISETSTLASLMHQIDAEAL